MKLYSPKQMLSTISLLIITLVSLFIATACEQRVILPDYSVLSAKLNDEELDTEKIIKINKDTLENGAILTISATHYNLDDTINTEAMFTFECENLKLAKTENSISILVDDFPSVGTYVIKSKSSVKSIFDKAVIIEITSIVDSLQVAYELKSTLPSSVSISDDERSGILSESNNAVTLISNGTYTLSITDGNGKALSNVLIEENDALINIRTSKNAAYEIFVNGIDKKKGSLKISHSFYKIAFTVYFTIRDIASIQVKENDGLQNTDNTPLLTLDTEEKSYDILLSSLSNSDVLQFSLDAEIIAQEKYYDGSTKNYIPEKNKNANWYRANSAVFTYNDESYYRVSFNGSKRTLTITPLKNTVFTLNNNEENLHTYIYIKYAEDTEARWKYRVLIGGKLEKLTLSLKNGDSEEELNSSNEISVNENTTTGWIFKANFTPENAPDKECLWYLARVNSFTDYKDENGTFFTAPTAFSQNSMGLKSVSLDYNDVYTLGDTSKGLKVYSYSITGSSKIDNSTIYVNYAPTSDDVAIVCINKKTKVYTFVNIKNRIKNTVTIKGAKLYGSYDNSSSTFQTLNMKSSVTVKTENGKEVISTPYKQNEKIQAYPDTVDKENFNIRTFYMGVNSTLTLEINSSISLSSITFSTDEVGSEVFDSPSVRIDAIDERKATITLSTIYKSGGISPENYITTKDGSIIKLKLNGEIPIIIKIIVFL